MSEKNDDKNYDTKIFFYSDSDNERSDEKSNCLELRESEESYIDIFELKNMAQEASLTSIVPNDTFTYIFKKFGCVSNEARTYENLYFILSQNKSYKFKTFKRNVDSLFKKNISANEISTNGGTQIKAKNICEYLNPKSFRAWPIYCLGRSEISVRIICEFIRPLKRPSGIFYDLFCELPENKKVITTEDFRLIDEVSKEHLCNVFKYLKRDHRNINNFKLIPSELRDEDVFEYLNENTTIEAFKLLSKKHNSDYRCEVFTSMLDVKEITFENFNRCLTSGEKSKLAGVSIENLEKKAREYAEGDQNLTDQLTERLKIFSEFKNWNEMSKKINNNFNKKPKIEYILEYKNLEKKKTIFGNKKRKPSDSLEFEQKDFENKKPKSKGNCLNHNQAK